MLTSEVSHEVAQTEAPQSSATEDEPVLQAKLELELQRQKELYSTLLRKTSQLQQLQQVNNKTIILHEPVTLISNISVQIYNVILLGYREIKSWLRSRKVMPHPLTTPTPLHFI